MSLATLKRKTQHKYNNNSVNQTNFSINGGYRNQGYIGQTSISRTNLRTPASGIAMHGHGSCCGNYDVNPLKTSSINTTEDSSVIKPSVLGTRGMLQKRHRWVRRPGPYSSTKPGDSMNQSCGSDYILYKRKKMLKECIVPEQQSSDSKCCKSATKSSENIGVAISQGDYILGLIGECANLDISYIEYNQTQNITNAPFGC